MNERTHLNLLSSEIWNCENAFQNECPMEWSQLGATDEQNVRHCSVCQKNVYFCETSNEFVEKGNAGMCVALPRAKTPHGFFSHMLGEPSFELLTKLAKDQESARNWWELVFAEKPKFNSEALQIVASEVKSSRALDEPYLSSENVKENNN